jgi:cell wall-associated NlpC family hydrolase
MAVPYYVCTLSHKNTFMDFWGWGDQLPVPPLKHRDFRSGVTDCFAMVRHYHWAAFGNVLPDYPRAEDWWDDRTAENPLITHMTNDCYHEVERADIQDGDGLLFKLRHNVVTHCGVYVSEGLFLHHMHGKISKTDPLVQWGRFLHKVMRYRG